MLLVCWQTGCVNTALVWWHWDKFACSWNVNLVLEQMITRKYSDNNCVHASGVTQINPERFLWLQGCKKDSTVQQKTLFHLATLRQVLCLCGTGWNVLRVHLGASNCLSLCLLSICTRPSADGWGCTEELFCYRKFSALCVSAWISVQTAIISSNIINQLIFVLMKNHVSFEVRTESNIKSILLLLQSLYFCQSLRILKM